MEIPVDQLSESQKKILQDPPRHQARNSGNCLAEQQCNFTFLHRVSEVIDTIPSSKSLIKALWDRMPSE